MEIVILGCVVSGIIALLNLITIFMVGRAAASMDKLAEKIDGKDGLNQRVTALEAKFHSCPTCREATEN